MARLRWVAITIALPLVYLVLLYRATRPPKPVYVFANPTVMTVTDKGGPAILHSPDVVYPPQALRDRVEGRVTLKVTVGADGTVARAAAVASEPAAAPAWAAGSRGSCPCRGPSGRAKAG